MARPISDEELQLRRRARRRLIGAIVLVTGLVVALPMVLDTEPRPMSGEISIKIPSPDSSKFTSKVVPVPPSAEPKAMPAARAGATGGEPSAPKFSAAIGEKAAPSPAEAAPAQPAVKEPKRAEAAREDVLPPAADVARKDAVPPSAADAARGPAFAVQVVALADVQKVKEIRAQIATAGLQSYTEKVHTAKGEVTRVRAGPYPTRAAAEKARDRLKAAGLPGNVVPK